MHNLEISFNAEEHQRVAEEYEKVWQYYLASGRGVSERM